MKYLIVLLFMLGCEEAAIEKPVETPVVSAPVTVETKKSTLAWGDKNPSWDKALYAAINELPDGELKTPCKKLNTKECAAQLISIMAKYESSFDPKVKFNETGHLQGVVSRGLLQISQDSANQSAYGCGIKKADDLHNAEINLKCAVKILAYQAKKSGTLIDEPKKGCAAYWSVCRKGSGSYPKIMKYMGQF